MATASTRAGYLSRAEFIARLEELLSIKDDTFRDMSLGDSIRVAVEVLQDGRNSMSIIVQTPATRDERHETYADSVYSLPDYDSTCGY